LIQNRIIKAYFEVDDDDGDFDYVRLNTTTLLALKKCKMGTNTHNLPFRIKRIEF
jgi:hypothetical protein